MFTIWGRWPRLSRAEQTLLRALATGATLKVHRDLDGGKVHRLHPLGGPAKPVDDGVVNGLKRCGLIDSNMKFPAATYLLTDKGKRAAAKLTKLNQSPLSTRSYSR